MMGADWLSRTEEDAVFGLPVALQPALIKTAEPSKAAPARSATSAAANDHHHVVAGSILSIFLIALLVGLLGLATAELLHYFRLESGIVPHVLTGIAAIALVIHLNLATQRKLMREVSSTLNAAAHYAERLEQFSIVDPSTELFNRKYLDQLFNQQLCWINRTGKAATLLLFEVACDGQDIAPENVMAEVARLLRSNFRGSDYIVRYDNHRLLVLLPETTEQQAEFALVRLGDKVDHRNLESQGAAIILRHELELCCPGGDLWAALQAAESKLCCKAMPCVAD
jgi:diguanylate cyclase (GGDEF)-like protein